MQVVDWVSAGGASNSVHRQSLWTFQFAQRQGAFCRVWQRQRQHTTHHTPHTTHHTTHHTHHTPHTTHHTPHTPPPPVGIGNPPESSAHRDPLPSGPLLRGGAQGGSGSNPLDWIPSVGSSDDAVNLHPSGALARFGMYPHENPGLHNP